MNIAIINGKKMYKRYVMDLRGKIGEKGIHCKIIKKTLANGENCYYEYSYKSVKRTPTEVATLVASGRDPKSPRTLFKEVLIRKERMSDYKDNYFEQQLKLGNLAFVGGEIITSEDIQKEIFARFPEYFNENTVRIYALIGGDSK